MLFSANTVQSSYLNSAPSEVDYLVNSFTSSLRTTKACQELLCKVQASQQQLRVWTQQGDWNSASFAGALAIVRNGKPFTDGEYAKTFMLDVANELFDDFLNKDKIIKRIKDMPLSARTVHNHTNMMANQIEETQAKGINAALFFSLALDESTDVSMLSVTHLPMKGTTRVEDLFKSFTEFTKGKNLPMDKLISVSTDGAPCMRPILSFHCILQHLNQLNVKIQGIGNAVLSLQQAVFAFENKLELFIADIETGRLLHFEKLGEFKDACTAIIQSALVSLSSSPIHTTVQDFELQVADMKASDMWVNKFKSLNEDLERLARQQAELASKHKWGEMKKLQPADQLIVKTWKALPVTYHTLQHVSIAVLTVFGSTCACEQSFSHLKNIKTNLRSHLMDGSLNACMKLNLTTYQPDYKAISKTMQHQKSH
uniref:HAT C-terminal dimerisation domain-containing protein n=1 Tax=Amphilophus citrinellus TaxID=61819 RepID=A0A3Q0RY82_AMPCI